MAVIHENLFSGESMLSPEVVAKRVPLKCIAKTDLVSITAIDPDKPIAKNSDIVQQYFEKILEKNQKIA